MPGAHPLFAQSLAEYGLLSAMRASIEDVAYSVRMWVSGISSTTWTVLAVVGLLALIVQRRSTSRS